ncbi:13956_t:CDS:2 [Entrophospora sp. SA101]|nr:13956_t:CDS:2 [Entrophospora sp. SA101]
MKQAFVVLGKGQKSPHEEACIVIKPGVDRNGQWASEDLVEQPYLRFPGAIGFVHFDNATSKQFMFAGDDLMTAQMNLRLGGCNKYTFKYGILPSGKPQKMHLEDERQKGIEKIMENVTFATVLYMCLSSDPEHDEEELLESLESLSETSELEEVSELEVFNRRGNEETKSRVFDSSFDFPGSDL